MEQLNTTGPPARVASTCPNPETLRPGSYYINLTARELGHPALRALTGRDLRYWLLNHLNKHPQTSHRVANLITTIIEQGFTIGGRPSKTVSDALATETTRGRITRTGWGQYQITRPLPSTTHWRIQGRLTELHRQLHQIITTARQTIQQTWRNNGIRSWLDTGPSATRRTLQAHIYVIPALVEVASTQPHNTTKSPEPRPRSPRNARDERNRKVADPTEKHEIQAPHVAKHPSQTSGFRLKSVLRSEACGSVS